jgi:endonuclease/exonuclease/phosphatase family metal-dependent hydrolase
MGNNISEVKDEDGFLLLKCMSYNIRFNNPDDKGPASWMYRRSGLADVVKKFEPDLLGCQEVLQDQLDFIQEELGESYTHVGKPREYNRQTKEYWGTTCGQINFNIF